MSVIISSNKAIHAAYANRMTFLEIYSSQVLDRPCWRGDGELWAWGSESAFKGVERVRVEWSNGHSTSLYGRRLPLLILLTSYLRHRPSCPVSEETRPVVPHRTLPSSLN